MRRIPLSLALLVTAACSASTSAGGTSTVDEPSSSLETLPEPGDLMSSIAPLDPEPSTTAPGLSLRDPVAGTSFVVADADGRIAVIDPDGTMTPVRDDGWRRTLGLDGSYTVSTALVGPGDTKVAWDAVPSLAVLGGTVLVGQELEVAATQVRGHLVALVNPAGAVGPDAIAGGRSSTTVVIASPEEGEVARYEVAGNVVPEAFGTALRSDGLPAQLFVLEYLPADAPARYRVRVLDTATGDLALPANLRDKTGPPVDQEMAGVTRGQVLAGDHGLLFTLYRGTGDMPHGHPYAFVHTLDLFDGVWCLDIPAEMELEHLPGSLATFGDRLYVASANGTVGAYSIADLLEPNGPVEMLWVARVLPDRGEGAPAIAAGPDGVVVTWPWMSGVHTVDHDGTVGRPIVGPAGTETIALHDGTHLVVTDGWWDLPGERPDWLGEVTRLVVVDR